MAERSHPDHAIHQYYYDQCMRCWEDEAYRRMVHASDLQRRDENKENIPPVEWTIDPPTD